MKLQDQVLELGVEGHNVWRLQVELRILGYYKDELTGIFDEDTQKAVRAFQEGRIPGPVTGIVDETTAEAIKKEYDLLLARRQFGIPALDPLAISRLKRAGVFNLLDVLRFDTEVLHARTKLDKAMLGRFRQVAEISQATGLSLENAYAMVEIGGISSAKELEIRSEEDLRKIFKAAEAKGLLSTVEAQQREFFLTRVTARAIKRYIFPDLRQFFRKLPEGEASKLASTGIRKGSDLRSMEIADVATRTGIDEARLQILKKAGELMAVRGITPEAALGLVEVGQVEGLEGLAKLEVPLFGEKMDALGGAGWLTPVEIQEMKFHATPIVMAARFGSCVEDICPNRDYLNYLINLPWSIEILHPGPFEDKVTALSRRFNQDFGRTEDAKILLVTVIIDVLERVVIHVLLDYRPILTWDPNEPRREWIIQAVSTIPADHPFFDRVPVDSPWALDQLPLPDTVTGSAYVTAILDLLLIIEGKTPTSIERPRLIHALSEQYKINLLCGEFKETTWLTQAILTLQGFLCESRIRFKTRQEWCLEQQRLFFPENEYRFKVPLAEISVVPETRQILDELYNQDVGPREPLRKLVGKIHDPKNSFVQVNIYIKEAYDAFMELELGRSLKLYTEEVENAISSMWPRGPLSTLDELIDDDQQWDRTINDFFAPPDDWISNPRSGYTNLITGMYWRKHPEISPAQLPSIPFYNFDYDLQSYIDRMEDAKPWLVPENDRHLGLDDWEQWLVPAYENAMITCLHYYLFMLPILKGDVLSELGDYERAKRYYDLVYRAEWQESVYPFLNTHIEVPMMRIRHGSNLLAWADSLYRENTDESIIRAKCLYQKVLDLYDNCVSSNEDPFTMMSEAIRGLIDLNFDTLPSSPSPLRLVLEKVANLRYRHIRAGEIPGLYSQVEEIVRGNDSKTIARGLSDLLLLEIIFSESRNVFKVVGTKLLMEHAEHNPDMPVGMPNYDGHADTGLAGVVRTLLSGSQGWNAGMNVLTRPGFGFVLPVAMPCKPPCNPVIEAQIQKARLRLSQIERCLNILGYSDEMVPVFRFEYLVNQAKMFVQLAIAAEKDFMQFLSNAEKESLDQLTAQQAVAMAAANLQVEQMRANLAQQQIEIARLQKDQVEQEIADLGVEIDEASDPIFKKAEWATASDEYASTVAIFGIPVGTILNQFTGGNFGNFLGNIAGGWADLFGGDPAIETRRKAAAKARENQINKLKRQKALMENYGWPLAQMQIDLAIAEHEIAQRQADIARLQAQHAQQILFFLQTKFLNKELWLELAKEIRANYRKMLDYAISMAFLAEQALEYDLNQRLNVIRFDYFKPNRHGLLGAENLQTDIAALEYQKIVLTENKKVPVKAVISLAEEYPQELMRFTHTGRAHFATDFTQFDLRFPGAYQSRISRVELVIEGLVPPEGIRGTLSNTGVSFTRTQDNRIQPLVGNPETMLLSSYTIRGDQVVFHKTGEELELFEGLGVITDWTLEMPKEANNLNYQTITDVKLVIYYTALYDENLCNLALRRWPKGGDAYRGFSMKFQFPDEFFHFQNDVVQDGNQYRATLAFKTLEVDFPFNQEHRRIANLSIVLAPSDADLPAPLPFLLSSQPAVDGGLAIVISDNLTRQDSFKHVRASSNIDAIGPDGTPEPAAELNGFANLDVNRDWELQLDFDPDHHTEFFKPDTRPEAAPGAVVPDLSSIFDILFFVEYRYDRTDLTVAEHFNEGAGHWDVTAGDWEVEDGNYKGSTNGAAEARTKLNVARALSRFPEEARGEFERSISDNVMISFRVKVDEGVGHNNNVRFYFANGHYRLTLGREGTSTRLSRLSTPYSGASTLLQETGDPDFLLKPGRWYKIEVGKFIGQIEVILDGSEVFTVVDDSPEEGPQIALGTSGSGRAFFGDVLI